MAIPKWYRRHTWTKTDEEEFFAKLRRAHKDQRAQYLKIQAMELIRTKKSKLLNIAEMLLNKVVSDFPDNNLEKSPVLNSLGEIYKLRKNYERSLDYYKQSIEFEKVFPNVITSSYLDFSELAIKRNKTEYFDFVETLLECKLQREIFPVSKYKICSILTVINTKNNKLDKAKYYSDLAELNANATTSGLRYHKYLGDVKKRISWLDKLVKHK